MCRLYQLALGVQLLAMVFLCSCRRETATTQPAQVGKVRVFVSILPQKYFVERVGGEHVKVSVLLRPGQSPHTYDPTPKQIVELSEAQVYFRTGVPFEKHVVAKVAAALKDLHIFDTCEGIDSMMIEDADHAGCGADTHADHDHAHEESHEEHGHEHVHHDEDEHAELHEHASELDPHVWMNPRLVKIQARTICRALGDIDPNHRDDYERNCKAFEADLDEADRRIAESLAPLKGREFYVFHPAFGYFAEAYGLKQVAVEIGGKQVTAKHLDSLIERAKESGVKLIFVQPQFTKQSAEVVAQAIGGAVVPMDPLAENYLENLLDVAAKIENALKGNGK